MTTSGGFWRRASGPLGLFAGLGLAGLLAWRIAVFCLTPVAPPPPDPDDPTKGGKPKTAGVDQVGDSGHGAAFVRNNNSELVLEMKFDKAQIRNDQYFMEGVVLRRILDHGRGTLIATGKNGVYSGKTTAGQLSGDVVVRRFPPEALEPDMTLRADVLNWDQAAGTLDAPDFAEMTWIDPKTKRKFNVGGTKLHAERWAETVRFERDVRVSLTEAALPDRLPLTEKRPADSADGEHAKKPYEPKGPSVTVITCAGPGTFENRTELGGRRAIFQREVKVTRQDLQMNSNRLELLLAPEHGRDTVRDGGNVSTLAAASGVPSIQALAARSLVQALRAGTPPPRPKTPPADSRVPPENDLVDLVLATGAVVLKGPDGTARGETACYDRPGGCIWLDGGATEPAEVMRGENQLVSQSFFFNLRTEEMSSEGRGRAKVTVKDEAKKHK